jgi:hypothetical protein
MPNSYPVQSELDTASVGYLFSKFVFGPACIYIGLIGCHLDRPLSLAVSVPLVFAGTFLLMLTRLRPDSSVLAFRRFFRWQELAYSEIKNCDDNLFLPFIGSVRFTHYVLPFGKIYFWIPISVHTSRIDKEMIAYIRRRAGLKPN